MPKDGVTISITTGTILKTLLILGGAWLAWFLRDIVLVVVAAVVIASAIEPAVRFFGKWRFPRLLSVILIYLILVVFLLSMFYLFLPSVLGEFTAFISSLPIYLETLNAFAGFDTYADIFGLPSPGDVSTADLLYQLREGLQFSGFTNVFSAASTIFGGFLSFILIVVLSFYFAMNATGVDDFLSFTTPARYRPYVLNLWKRSQHKIGLWMQGQLLLAAIVGILVYLSLTILGIKHALLLAVIAAMFELIPVFGPTLAAVPATLIAFVDGGVILGVTVIALYAIIQQFENHLLYPLVVTKVVGVPPLLVILGLIIGAKLAGFLGVLLSVPIAAIVQELVRDVSERKQFATEPEAV